MHSYSLIPGSPSEKWETSPPKQGARWMRWMLMAAGVVFLVGLSGYKAAEEHARRTAHPAAPVHNLAFNKSLVLNFEEPQTSFSSQLKDEVRYITSLPYGGHANQMISIYHLLYAAKLLHRVPIIPTLLPEHFAGAPANIADYYDMPRFHSESKISALTLDDITSVRDLKLSPSSDRLSCWSILERVSRGGANVGGNRLMASHGVYLNFWPLPELSAGTPGGDIRFSHLDAFDTDKRWRESWIAQAQRDFLPQKKKSLNTIVDNANNIKDGFNPSSTPPTDQLMCLDTTFFVTFPRKAPAFPTLASARSHPTDREGDAWIHAGQYLHFTPEVESVADDFLLSLFEKETLAEVPPFISVHIRRGDFKSTYHFTAIEEYIKGVERIRARIQDRIDNPDSWDGPGKGNENFPRGVAAADYRVIFTSDEEAGSPFMQEVLQLGWLHIDHKFWRTREVHGDWYPTALDQALLARGRGFLGTNSSTYSHLSGFRVRYWNGGVSDETPWVGGRKRSLR